MGGGVRALCSAILELPIYLYFTLANLACQNMVNDCTLTWSPLWGGHGATLELPIQGLGVRVSSAPPGAAT